MGRRKGEEEERQKKGQQARGERANGRVSATYEMGSERKR